MDPEYARRYRLLYREHWWWRARRLYLLDVLDELCPGGGWRNVLDVGCGAGLFFDDLEAFADRVEGVEPDADLVAAEGTPTERIHVRPFDASFRPDREYGLVLMLDVLEHMDDPGGALRHAGRLLEPGGRLLVTVPAFRWLWTTHDEVNRHRTRYDRRSLSSLAEASKIEVLRMAYFFHWTVPAKLLVRVWEVLRRPEPTPPSVPPPWLNRLLYGLSRLEQRLPGPVGLLPGSSLLMVGRRRGS